MARVPRKERPAKRRRKILLPASDASIDTRPIRSETRDTLIEAIARGRRWLNELTIDPQASAGTIAQREGCSPRKVNMTISLAFLSPALFKAALHGHLPAASASPGSATCRPSGPASTEFSDSTREIPLRRTRLRLTMHPQFLLALRWTKKANWRNKTALFRGDSPKTHM